MSGMYAKRVRRHSAEDRRQRNASRKVEPLLDRLAPGRNVFVVSDYHALVVYFLGDDIRRRDQALAEYRFRILDVEVACEKTLSIRNGVTLSEFARQHGIRQDTLWRRAHKAGLSGAWFGGKKLFFPEDLEALL